MSLLRRSQPFLSLKKTTARANVKSKGTLSQQDHLLKLPLPSLSDTINKWLPTTLPHLNKEEFKTTQQHAQDFIQQAEPMQKYLQDKSISQDNWFADWWLDMAYLEYRDPLSVWSSPGLVLPPFHFSGQSDWLSFVARFTCGALEYKQKLDTFEIPIDMSGKSAMDMRQYYQLFGANRVPGQLKDSQKVNDKADYVTVVYRGHFFNMKIMDNNGNRVAPQQVYSSLYQIVQHVDQRLGETGQVGLLTTEDRDSWYEAYNALKGAGNSKAIGEIENSLFLLCLDEEIKDSSCTLAQTAKNSLHGLGTAYNGHNRWMDKALQFIIARSGQVAISNEHSFAEAVPTMNIADFCLDQISKSNLDGFEYSGSNLQPIKHISFNIDPDVQAKIDQASKKIDKLHGDLEMEALDFQTFGKEFIKTCKVSPDSFVQMAIQLAFFKLHQQPAATYESAATRIFNHGRTEVIRSCLPESLAFTEVMTGGENLNQKLDAFKTAVVAHNTYARSAAQGLGVDRHLQGLKKAAQELGLAIPPLYSDPGYTRSSRMRLSTSQISSRHGGFCCYGPLQTDGYGCSYSIGSNSLQFSVSAMNFCEETSALHFKQHLEESLIDLHDLCIAKPKL